MLSPSPDEPLVSSTKYLPDSGQYNIYIYIYIYIYSKTIKNYIQFKKMLKYSFSSTISISVLHDFSLLIITSLFKIDPACWPERRSLPRLRIDLRTASIFRPSPRSTSRTCKRTERRPCGRSHSNAQVSDWTTKYWEQERSRNLKEPCNVLSHSVL